MTVLKPRVVITGIAGFIGSNLAVRLLDEGYQVIGIDNLSSGLREQVPERAGFYEIDVRSKDLYKIFHEGDVVFHLAAKNCINDCLSDPVETISINVTGTANVFEIARRANVKKVIYAESSALYEGIRIFPTPEEAVHPISFYAVSKHAGMEIAQAYKRFYNLKITGLRYFCVYGPRQDYRRTIPPVMSAFIIKLLRGERPIIYGDGKKRRDFIHIDDVNAFHLACITNPQTDGRVFNLGSGLNYSVQEIFNWVAAILKTDIKPIYKPDLPGEAQETLADISAARTLGWEPQISLEEGLQGFVDYYKRTGIPWTH